MNDIIKAIEDAQLKSEVTDFRVGDTVKVYAKVIEGSRERIQVFEGTVLKRQNGGARETFRGKARRAKLFYLRDRVGKAAKVKEIVK